MIGRYGNTLRLAFLGPAAAGRRFAVENHFGYPVIVRWNRGYRVGRPTRVGTLPPFAAVQVPSAELESSKVLPGGTDPELQDIPRRRSDGPIARVLP